MERKKLLSIGPPLEVCLLLLFACTLVYSDDATIDYKRSCYDQGMTIENKVSLAPVILAGQIARFRPAENDYTQTATVSVKRVFKGIAQIGARETI